MAWRVDVGDASERLREMPDRSVQCCVTSPPYFGLRDYGTGEWEGGDDGCDHSMAAVRVVGNAPSLKSTLTTNNGAGPRPGDKFHADQRREVATECPCGARRVDRQLGLEPTPDEYVARLVEVFREVRRVLRDDGTLWLNIGDSYAGGWGNQGDMRERDELTGRNLAAQNRVRSGAGSIPVGASYKAKDLIGIPWLLAFALRGDGWYLRSDVIWAKPNPMPESVTDRPTSAHEHLFLLAKSSRYFYDADAIREGYAPGSEERIAAGFKDRYSEVAAGGFRGAYGGPNGEQVNPAGRNKRNVWEIATQPYAEAHFATFPPKLVEPCVLAGSPPCACGECGAPWRRVTERVASGYDGSTYGERAVEAAGGALTGGTARSTLGSSNGKLTGQYETKGWKPTCEHRDDSGRSVVLDPFAGSGTVGVVCGWLGRDFIGIELSPEYAEMARRRIESEGRLGRRAHRPESRQTEALF